MRSFQSSIGGLWCALTASLVAVGSSAQSLEPGEFASLGSLNLANGTFTIDTDALTISGSGGTLFTGVVDDQQGRASSPRSRCSASTRSRWIPPQP